MEKENKNLTSYPTDVNDVFMKIMKKSSSIRFDDADKPKVKNIHEDGIVTAYLTKIWYDKDEDYVRCNGHSDDYSHEYMNYPISWFNEINMGDLLFKTLQNINKG